VTQIEFSRDGKLVATTSDDGTVRTWYPDDGRPYWWSALLDPAGHRLHTHRGWVDVDDDDAEALADVYAWERALSVDARVASASTTESHLCIGTHRGELAVWDRKHDRRVSTAEVGGLTSVLAVPQRCLALGAGQVTLHSTEPSHEPKLLARAASAVGFADGTILVAGAEAIVGFDASGQETLRLPGREALAAASMAAGNVALGYTDGTVELVSPADGKTMGPTLEGRVGSSIVSLAPGPRGLLAAGHANGTVLVWDLATGALLATEYLHGSALHLAFAADKLYAATDLEDHVALDVAIYGRDYCDLMAEVWRDQPGVWEGGKPVRRDVPAAHRCAR
jgi:hypothetical protein